MSRVMSEEQRREWERKAALYASVGWELADFTKPYGLRPLPPPKKD